MKAGSGKDDIMFQIGCGLLVVTLILLVFALRTPAARAGTDEKEFEMGQAKKDPNSKSQSETTVLLRMC